MKITPEEDGSLHIDSPDATTLYDMGNQSLFAQFNGAATQPASF